MTSKWMWLSSAHSQLTLPTLPMVCPAETVSPFFTLASVVPQTRQILPEANSQIVGFRYFNVYGPREGHKGSMASVAFHLNTQLNNGESPKLFEGSDGFKRDFVYVGDVADVNLWFWENGVSGIFNLGTGRAESFQAVADATLAFHKKGSIEYIPFPDKLKGRYQAFTQADLTNLRKAGYDKPFKTVAEGVTEYMAWLNRDA